MVPNPELIEAAIEALIALTKMIIQGLFALVGAVFSFFYQVYENKLRPKAFDFFMYCFLAFGVGMIAGEFIKYAPSYIAENLYASLFLVGVYWRTVVEFSKVKIKSILKSNDHD